MGFADEWSNKNLHDRRLALSHFIDNAAAINQPDYLDIVRAPNNWGIYASNGPNFKYAVFGRDSIVVAEDLLLTHKDLAHDIILVLAKLQGTTTNDDSEEEPGKIHHEYRSVKYDGKTIPDYSLGILRNLQKLWGNEGSDTMTYYGGYDATPLYVRLVCHYVKNYGDSILQEEYTTHDGHNRKINESLHYAIGWITYKINESALGLLEYKRINPHGIENQAWKDSRTGYLKRDGSMPDFNKGIASIEIQGYVYDALILSSELISENEEEKDYWRSIAMDISKTVLDLFWMEDVSYFAQAVYLDENDNHQKIDTVTSNGALILNSQLLSDVNHIDRVKYVEGVSKMICSKEFITAAGIRSRALRHMSIPDFIDYHGTYTVWHKESNEIAKGLRRHNLYALAAELEKRMIDAVVRSGEFSEFYYVDIDNKVWYDKAEAIHYFSHKSTVGNLPIPEPGQAWTISSIYRICLDKNYKKEFEVSDFEKTVLLDIPSN